MPDLLTDNLNYLRQRVGSGAVSNPLLQQLWQQVVSGGAEVLRISPHRTVLKCGAVADSDSKKQSWLLKLYHPRRSMERVRRLVRAAPALREEENWRLLAQRLGLEFALVAEQITTDVGMLVRPYWTGKRVAEGLQANNGQSRFAMGIARLHRAHWTDSDLDADDLLFVDDFDGMLLPLDLGHAKVSLLKPPAEAVYTDLQKLIASLPHDLGGTTAISLLKNEHHGDWLKGYQPQDLFHKAMRMRTDHAWKRSRRCLRTVSDFERSAGSSRRRECVAQAPSMASNPNQANAASAALTEPIKSGPRSTLHHVGDLAWKHYPRTGIGQQLRKRAMLGPACQAFRKLYFLELLGFAVAPIQVWQASADGEWLATTWLDGSPPTAHQLPQIATYLAELHAAGIGLRDAKPSNFIMAKDAQLHLIDADGIRPLLRNPWRDLARVIAEVDADSEMESQCLETYSTVRNQREVLVGRKWHVPELLRRTAKDADYFRGLLRLQKPQP